jgi:cobalt/nickel transport system permease protein
MHMADALISPAVGGTMWAAAAGLTVYSARKLRQETDERKIPLMGVLGALVFAAQMINFTIPGTGSSGHLGGGILLAVLLGPYAGFLTMASILTIQALFFADGGLLALGCNIFNLGFFPCFIAFPFVYNRITAGRVGRKPIFTAALAGAIVGLQLGALGVVVETVLSGVSELPLVSFLLLMLPIHLAIGIVEGLVSASLIGFVYRSRPEVLENNLRSSPGGDKPGPYTAPAARTATSLKPLLLALILIAAFTGGVLSWFASTNPDGLEWSIAGITGNKELKSSESWIHTHLSGVQKKIALFPGYNFKEDKNEASGSEDRQGKGDGWPEVRAGTSVSGLLGGAMSLVLAGLIGFGIRICKRSPRRRQD